VPELAAFLRTPVATPTACPPNVNGSTVGRHSPWVGTVDVSVFVKPTATSAQVTTLGQQLRATTDVVAVYFESQAQAYAEFQRLYTCSARVRPEQVPASYRLVLTPGLSLITRDDLVRKIIRLTGVATVSCDPSTPCVDAAGSG
jgi:cell division protein FtsX